VREGGEKWEKGPVMLLTATRSSWGTCAMAESGEAAGGRGAAGKVAERPRVCEAGGRLRVLRDRGRGAASL
jgi:hypothetical protein